MLMQFSRFKPSGSVCLLKQVVKRSTALGVATGLAIAFPLAPASARNDYQSCAVDLGRSGISPELTAQACSEALSPDDLGACVSRITLQPNTVALAALSACRQVRRPVDMASCYVRIRQQIQDSTVPQVLDNCRRSLLPVRFADCVLGVSRETKLASTQVIDTCVSGGDYPRDFGPVFIPTGQIPTPLPATEPPATTPTPVPSPAP